MSPRACFHVVALSLFSACGSEEPALDIALAPDSNVNAPETIMTQVGSIVFVIDSPDGLYAADEAAAEADFQIKNADADPNLELVITTATIDARLPQVRLERGGLPQDAWLHIKALGLPASGGDATVARGELKGAKFEEGIAQVAVPFNLLPEYLPPRVIGVDPLVNDCTLIQLTIQFSKAIDPASVAGSIAVQASTSGSAAISELRSDPTSGKVVDVLLDPGISIAGGVTVTVEISTRVRDGAGNPLDDVPMQPGDQPYSEDLMLSHDAMTPCPHVMLPRCGAGLPGEQELCPAGFGCSDDGVCLPQSCDVVSCVPGYVCDPASPSCEVDCRLYGDDACLQGSVCDPVSGVCVLP